MIFLDYKGVLADLVTGKVYEDGAQYLRGAENSAIIITSGGALLRADIEKALAGIPRLSIMTTDGVAKGEYLAPYVSMYGQSPKFIDDDPHELEVLAATCPTFQLFEMRRDGNPGDGRWPVIHSLGEVK